MTPRQADDGRLRYFLPDAQDHVDANFDFEHESRSTERVARYAHEVFRERVHDGILLSKGIVDAVNGNTSRFSRAARLRLEQEGVRAFYRLPDDFSTMGDCGAFTYVKQEHPPFTVDDVVAFYDQCGFDYGVSIDHIIEDFEPAWDDAGPPASVRHRQMLTLDLARDFWRRSRGLCFAPMGVAQGWSPRSIAASVRELQRIGFTYIAIGGLVPLKREALLKVVRAAGAVRRPGTRFHLLGVAQPDLRGDFGANGVASTDSTSPLRQAWMDGKKNYHAADATYTALRVPQVDSNPKLKRAIASGSVNIIQARRLESATLRVLADFDAGRASVDAAVQALVEYEAAHNPGRSLALAYQRTLEAVPWKRCPCAVCRALGHHVILFRGAERNRRRGLHNIWTFYRRLEGDRIGEPVQLSLRIHG